MLTLRHCLQGQAPGSCILPPGVLVLPPLVVPPRASALKMEEKEWKQQQEHT